MDNIKFALAVEMGRDGFNKAALCMITPTERWAVFNDMMGICFRRRIEKQVTDFTADEMKARYMGIYRILASKWNQISMIVKSDVEVR